MNHMDNEPPTHRRWLPLTPEQRQLAADLAERAERIRARAEDGMSFREAIDLAAAQLGIDDRTGQ